MIPVSLIDYRSDVDLDAELAQLVYLSVQGWSDQRPITGALVRSLLRPGGMTATSLVLHRGEDGRLLGAGAVRWPPTLDATGRTWGPLVLPSERGRGIGRAILTAMLKALAEHPGIRMMTSEIPGARTAGWTLYESAGWQGSGVSQLLERSLPGPDRDFSSRFDGVPVRSARQGEYLDQALAGLVAEARPDLGYATARDTFARWSADTRYTPDGLLLAEGPDGLHGAALVYPLSNAALGEPAEAWIADVLTSTRLDQDSAAYVRAALIAAALRAGAAAGAKVARAVVDCPYLTQTLRAAGFEVADEIRYYAPPVRPS
jgi:GNAT superfamily N-acetyltransferase